MRSFYSFADKKKKKKTCKLPRFSLLACYSIVFPQLLAWAVNILCFGDRLAIAPKQKVSSSLMLGVVRFLLAAEKGIAASKLTFIT